MKVEQPSGDIVERFDLESDIGELDHTSQVRLITLSSRWQRRNAAERAQRELEQALGPRELS